MHLVYYPGPLAIVRSDLGLLLLGLVVVSFASSFLFGFILLNLIDLCYTLGGLL